MTALVPPDQRDRQDARRLEQAILDQQEENRARKKERLQRAAQRCLIWANVTNDALSQADEIIRPPWTHLLSADRGVWTPDAGVVDALAAHGCEVKSWCDCRTPPDGTSAQAAIDLAADPDLNLDGWVGQAEDLDELKNSVGIDQDGMLVRPQGTERARIIVGNPNAWTPEQRSAASMMVAGGDLAVMAEVYRVDPLYSSQGVPIASVVYGVAMDGGVRYPLTDYLAAMPTAFDFTFGVWHAAGLHPEDWQAMEALGDR